MTARRNLFTIIDRFMNRFAVIVMALGILTVLVADCMQFLTLGTVEPGLFYANLWVVGGLVFYVSADKAGRVVANFVARRMPGR